MGRFIPSFVLVFFGAGPCRAQMPKLFQEKTFTCVTFAEAVNHYVSLGEKAAVRDLNAAALDWDKDFRGEFSRSERVGWVCRVLFRPKEKEPLRGPRYGSHFMPLNSMPLKSWPLYPVACSGSTYFVLSEGYSLAGLPERPKDYLEYCRTKGNFRTASVPIPTKLQALKDLDKLRQSAPWTAIKWKDSGPDFSYTMSEDRAWAFMKAQAERIPDK